MPIDYIRYNEELLILARAIKSIQQTKMLTRDNLHKLNELDCRERVLVWSLLNTILDQLGERDASRS